MNTVSIKAEQIHTITYNRKPVMIATKLDNSREHIALYWKVGDKDTELFILRARYVKKHGLIKAVEAAVKANKIKKDVLFYMRRLQSTLGA